MRRNLSHPTSPVDFTDFFVPYTCTLSLNWPHGNDAVLSTTTIPGTGLAAPSTSSTSPPRPSSAGSGGGAGGGVAGETKVLSINPSFMAHLRDLRNWSLGSRFRNTFPFLCDGTVRIED
jgi:hypothetical protein